MLMRRMLWVEHEQVLVGRWWSEESIQVDDDLGRQCCGASCMKDGQPGIIVHDQGVLREGLRTVGAPFRETPNSCPKALFVVEDEHMAFSYTNSWKLARSSQDSHLLRMSVRNGRKDGKGVC